MCPNHFSWSYHARKEKFQYLFQQMTSRLVNCNGKYFKRYFIISREKELHVLCSIPVALNSGFATPTILKVEEAWGEFYDKETN